MCMCQHGMVFHFAPPTPVIPLRGVFVHSLMPCTRSVFRNLGFELETINNWEKFESIVFNELDFALIRLFWKRRLSNVQCLSKIFNFSVPSIFPPKAKTCVSEDAWLFLSCLSVQLFCLFLNLLIAFNDVSFCFAFIPLRQRRVASFFLVCCQKPPPALEDLFQTCRRDHPNP